MFSLLNRNTIYGSKECVSVAYNPRVVRGSMPCFDICIKVKTEYLINGGN